MNKFFDIGTYNIGTQRSIGLAAHRVAPPATDISDNEATKKGEFLIDFGKSSNTLFFDGMRFAHLRTETSIHTITEARKIMSLLPTRLEIIHTAKFFLC